MVLEQIFFSQTILHLSGLEDTLASLITRWLVLINAYIQPFGEPLFATTDTTLELQLDLAVHAIFRSFLAPAVDLWTGSR